MRDCRKCRDWRGCAGADWFSYGDIRFCLPQMLWLIAHLKELGEGSWPMGDEGFVQTPYGAFLLRQEGYFVKAAEIAGEVSWRLSKTNTDGKLLVAEIEAGLTQVELQYESRRALAFVSGWRRRRENYETWKHRRARHNLGSL